MTTDLNTLVENIGRQARDASRVLAQTSTAQKNDALVAIAEQLENETEAILAANRIDLDGGAAKELGAGILDRLRLDENRVRNLAASVRQVALLPDPVGEIMKEWVPANGLRISKVRVPIGVIGIIYESRPNVTSDAASLCLKTGNAVILRGGSESIRSNIAISEALARGCVQAGLPAESIQLLSSTDRAGVTAMAKLDRYIHLIIPRGGRALIETVAAEARMPVIKHYEGICHIYVDRAADMQMAEQIVVNAKCQRPGVCNAVETLLVDEPIASTFLPRCVEALSSYGVKLLGDERTRQILGDGVGVATEKDWLTEYLDLVLSIRVVSGVDEAVDHIERYGSHHSDAIISDNEATAQKFLNQIDSAAVFWNASTRFNDGAEFGFGAEIGISTDRLHARGPMGLEELTSYKYLVKGTGQVRT
jgi:glutamate-5-semialdehyde dehydrogenase